jgi:pyrimidine operon attenuation protein/uracil phosphoribosyltransferase
MSNKTLVINREKAAQKIIRISYEILEHNFDEKELILVGIANRGYKVAEKVLETLEKIAPEVKFTLHALKLDKDDVYDLNKIEFSSNIEDLSGKTVIIIDDVLNSGKTLMYAVKYILNAPLKKLNTVVLVDRRHRNFPIRADFAGLTLSTTILDHIYVEFKGDEIEVYLD